jgi:hypothetical protein
LYNGAVKVLGYYRCARVGITTALKSEVKNEAPPVERRKHDRAVGLDRRRYDDDFAERMTGGIRMWSSERSRRSSSAKVPRHK